MEFFACHPYSRLGIMEVVEVLLKSPLLSGEIDMGNKASMKGLSICPDPAWNKLSYKTHSSSKERVRE